MIRGMDQLTATTGGGVAVGLVGMRGLLAGKHTLMTILNDELSIGNRSVSECGL